MLIFSPMKTVPKKQVVAKAPVKVAAAPTQKKVAPTQKSSSSEDSSSEEEEGQRQPMKKKAGDYRGISVCKLSPSAHSRTRRRP